MQRQFYSTGHMLKQSFFLSLLWLLAIFPALTVANTNEEGIQKLSSPEIQEFAPEAAPPTLPPEMQPATAPAENTLPVFETPENPPSEMVSPIQAPENIPDQPNIEQDIEALLSGSQDKETDADLDLLKIYDTPEEAEGLGNILDRQQGNTYGALRAYLLTFLQEYLIAQGKAVPEELATTSTPPQQPTTPGRSDSETTVLPDEVLAEDDPFAALDSDDEDASTAAVAPPVKGQKDIISSFKEAASQITPQKEMPKKAPAAIVTKSEEKDKKQKTAEKEEEKQEIKFRSPPQKRKKKIHLSEADKEYLRELARELDQLPRKERLSEGTQNTVDKIAEELGKVELVSKGRESKINVEHTDKPSSIDLKVKTRSEKLSVSDIDLERAYRALLAGQTAASIAIYKSVLKEDSKNIDAKFGLATAYHRSGQYEKAKKLYTSILKKQPDHAGVLNNFLILAAEEAPDNALIELKKLEKIKPGFSPIPAQIGMIYVKKKEFTEAERYLKRAVSLSPENLIYQYNLAVTSDRLKKYDQAIFFYDQLVSSEKTDVVSIPMQEVSNRVNFLKSKVLQ